MFVAFGSNLLPELPPQGHLFNLIYHVPPNDISADNLVQSSTSQRIIENPCHSLNGYDTIFSRSTSFLNTYQQCAKAAFLMNSRESVPMIFSGEDSISVISTLVI
jgi:hypothetical protein